MDDDDDDDDDSDPVDGDGELRKKKIEKKSMSSGGSHVSLFNFII